MNIKEAVHYSDLYFVNYCQDRYGINRGIYNTIDRWFYDQGTDNILERRKNILLFLEYIQKDHRNGQSRIKFGNGGLTIKLNEFLDSSEYMAM